VQEDVPTPVYRESGGACFNNGSLETSVFVGQVVNLRPIVDRPFFWGQPILAAAGFQPALFVSRFASF
jgi:hypothetical protein